MSDRKSYSDELKAEAIKMVKEQGLSHAEVSKRLSIPKGTIGNWTSGIGLGMKKWNLHDTVVAIGLQLKTRIPR